MARLSRCIFKSAERKFELFMSAKKREMVAAGIPHPSAIAVKKAITNEKLVRDYRRRTWGTEKTVEQIETLHAALNVIGHGHSRCAAPQRGGKGDLGGAEASCPLPPGSPRGGTVHHKLPVLRCARGSTSLESFHLYLARFIPGTSASAFQAYLLDGITRRNAAHASAAIQSPEEVLRTFASRTE
jgi:hypothetical protein